jgi:hypothetical protein
MADIIITINLMRKIHETDVIKLINDGACVTLKASPGMMLSWSFADLTEGLQFCMVCPVVRECLKVVSPRGSFFDGVAGNRAWRDGKDITDDVKRMAPYSEFYLFDTTRMKLLHVRQAANGRYPIMWLTKNERMLLTYVAILNMIDERKIAKWLDIPVTAVNLINLTVKEQITDVLAARASRIQFTGRNIKKVPPASWRRPSDAVLLKERVERGSRSDEIIDQRACLG